MRALLRWCLALALLLASALAIAWAMRAPSARLEADVKSTKTASPPAAPAVPAVPAAKPEPPPRAPAPAIGPPSSERVAAGLRALLAAYPDFLDRVDGNDLVWKDGTRMAIDDGKGPKDFETLLNAADLKDQFVFRYELGLPARVPGLNEDPGRIRHMPFFNKMYGDCTKGEVLEKLVDVDWLPRKNGGKVKITSMNGIADRLAAVSRELDELPDEFLKYLIPNSGTYNCRPIANTSRISAHGHGIAIDLNSEQSDYWLWTKPDANGLYPYKNRVPFEIIAIFEKHGFVWGGKWYHYDTMHFEYRPELLSNPN